MAGPYLFDMLFGGGPDEDVTSSLFGAKPPDPGIRATPLPPPGSPRQLFGPAGPPGPDATGGTTGGPMAPGATPPPMAMPPPPDGGQPTAAPAMTPQPDQGQAPNWFANAASKAGHWFTGSPVAEAGGGVLQQMGLAPEAPSRITMLGSALLGLSGGILGARANPATRNDQLASGLLGAAQGLQQPLQQFQAAQQQGVGEYARLAAALSKGRRKPIVVDGHLVDPDTGRSIYDAPEKPGKAQVFGSEGTGYFTMGPDGKPQRLIDPAAPKPDKPQVFGSAESGFYTLGPDGQPQKLVGGMGRAPEKPQIFGGTTTGFYALTPKGAQQLVPGNPAADKPPPTIEERDRELFNRVQSTVQDKGWDAVPPADIAAYQRAYREKATPKQTVDPSGLITTVTPDVTDLPVPPGYKAAGQEPGQPPRPGIETPPVSGVAAKTALETHQTIGPVLDNIDETIKLLENSTPADRAGGPVRTQLEQRMQGLIAGSATLGNTGVVSPTEAETYRQSFGNLTGLFAAGKAAAGFDQSLTALKTLRDRTVAYRNAKLPRVTSSEEAMKMPPGIPFLMPNGKVGMRPPPASP